MFVVYDVGYCVIIGNFVIDSLIGMFVVDFCCGFLIGWWKSSYNVYYFIINMFEYDFDI